MLPQFDSWTGLVQADAEHWRGTIEASLKECVSRTRTSAVSRVVPFDVSDAGNGSLAGVPYGLMEAFDLKGYPTTSSSRAPCLARSPARGSAAVVEHLSKLGAVCVAKTQMDELADGLSGENPHFGNCPHPTVAGGLSGGSSSGSAYVVGAGVLPVGIGVDTRGSIRIPAAWCGIYGIRWIPGYMTEGMRPLASSFDTIGWFTKSAGEMAMMLRAWFALDPDAAEGGEGPIKLASIRAEEYLERDTREKLGKVFDQLPSVEYADASAWEMILPDVRVAFNILQSTEAFENFSSTIEAHGLLMDPAVVGRVMRAREWSGEQKLWAADVRERVAWMFDSFFSEYDCLVMPVCSGPTRPATHASVKRGEDTLNLTALASMAGLPALTVPVFLDEVRSVGLQFVFKDTEAKVPLKLLDLWSDL